MVVRGGVAVSYEQGTPVNNLLLRGEEAFGVLFLVAQTRDRAFDCREVDLCWGVGRLRVYG
jgi:hypothetical protein